MSLKPVHCEASDWPVVEGIGARMPCNGHHWHCSATSAPKMIQLQDHNYPASLALRRHVVAIREELQVTLTDALHCTDLQRSAQIITDLQRNTPLTGASDAEGWRFHGQRLS